MREARVSQHVHYEFMEVAVSKHIHSQECMTEVTTYFINITNVS